MHTKVLFFPNKLNENLLTCQKKVTHFLKDDIFVCIFTCAISDTFHRYPFFTSVLCMHCVRSHHIFFIEVISVYHVLTLERLHVNALLYKFHLMIIYFRYHRKNSHPHRYIQYNIFSS